MLLSHIDGLVRERRNSSALALELRLSCTNLGTWELKLISGHRTSGRITSVQVMVLHRTGYKPLSEPVQTQFQDAFVIPGLNELKVFEVKLQVFCWLKLWLVVFFFCFFFFKVVVN